jgi:hypothetical protein
MDPAEMPDDIEYDASTHRLIVGGGWVDGVSPEVWAYSISGKCVLRQWFSYRKQNRERPILGDRRPPSPLSLIQPDSWLAEYTTELLDLLHVLGRIIELEPAQAGLLERICDGPLISLDELQKAGAFAIPADYPKQPTATVTGDRTDPAQTNLFKAEAILPQKKTRRGKLS